MTAILVWILISTRYNSAAVQLGPFVDLASCTSIIKLSNMQDRSNACVQVNMYVIPQGVPVK